MKLHKNQSLYTDYRLLLLILLSIITFFAYLGKAPVYILDEAKNAQCAREMLENNNWVVPTFNQQLRADKPPLHYYFMSAAYRVFGVNEFAARFFSAVCGLLVVVFTYRFAARHINRQVGLISGLILLSSWQFGLEMRMAVPDPYLILLMLMTMYGFYQFWYSSYTQSRYLYLVYMGIGLGILCKGPVALLLSGLIVFFFLLAQKQFTWENIKALKPLYGLLLIAAISLPWYYLVHQQTQGLWTQDFFYKHNLKRFTGAKEKHGGLFILTILFVVGGLLPFSLMIVQAGRQFFLRNINNSFMRFLGISALVIILFFSIAQTRLPNYPMPCYPFLSILIANYLWCIIRQNKSIRVYIWVLTIISLAIPVALNLIIAKEPSLQTVRGLWQYFLILPLFMIVALLNQYSKRRNTRVAVYITMAGFIFTGWILNLYAYPKVYSLNPVFSTLRLKGTNEPLVSYRMYNAAYNFYLKKPVQRFETPTELTKYLDQHPDAKIVTREGYLPELDSLPFRIYYQQKDIFENHTNFLLKYK